MAQVADKLWTLEEFLAFDDGNDTSYQLFEGRIVAMNPPLRGHGTLCARLTAIVTSQLKPRCEVVAAAGIVPINRRHSWYKADLIVTCTPGSYRDPFIAEPVLVIEVLSPTTTAIDFNRKLPDYQQIPSMRDILLVSSMERLVRHWRREPDGWMEHRHRRAATVRLSGLPVTIAMRDLYDGILPRLRRYGIGERPMATTEAEVNEAHREKMARIKAVKDRIYASKTIEKGLLIVHTGTGKGKSTAAWGLAMRCLGHGLKLGVVQFVKGRRDTGERHLLERFPEQVTLKVMGEGFTWETQDRARDIAAARAAWDAAKAMLQDPELHMVILDELNIVLRKDYLPLDEVLAGLRARRPDLHVVVTGRNAKPELIEAADLVTEMTLVKHPFRAGVKAQLGVEF